MISIPKKDINLYDTIFSGQTFRMTLESDKSITLLLSDRVINIKENNKYLLIESNNEDNLENIINEYLEKDTVMMKLIVILNNAFKCIIFLLYFKRR